MGLLWLVEVTKVPRFVGELGLKAEAPDNSRLVATIHTVGGLPRVGRQLILHRKSRQ